MNIKLSTYLLVAMATAITACTPNRQEESQAFKVDNPFGKALRAGYTVERIHSLTKIDKWF